MSEPSAEAMAPPPQILELRDRLRSAWGPEFIQVRRLLHELDGEIPWPPEELIRRTALSHKAVSALLRDFDPWLDKSGPARRLASRDRHAVRTVFGLAEDLPQAPDDSLDIAARSHPALAEVRRLIHAAPRGNRHLDHVSATPEAVLKRALFLRARYQLDAGGILFLGDHDLTSLALALLLPGLPISVLDVDERVLEFIAAEAAARQWRIRVIAADLRVELPPSLKEGFGLVFTDPPYTPQGVLLFLARAIQALSSCPFAQILMAYGYGEAQTGLGFRVQSAIHELRLLMQAILPRFGTYEGAQAIGSNSALYVCRPTRRSHAAARAVQAERRIYSHGVHALESGHRALPGRLTTFLGKHFEDVPPGSVEWVGEDAPQGLPAVGSAISLPGFLTAMVQAQGKPPFTRAPHCGILVVDLFPHLSRYLLPVLLTSAARQLAVIVAGTDFDTILGARAPRELRRLVASAYCLDPAGRARCEGITLAFLERIPQDAGSAENSSADFLLRYVIDHRRARLGNAWREALVAAAGLRGRSLTKNQARELIRETGYPADQLHCLLRELPASLVVRWVQAALASLAAADCSIHGQE